MSGLSHYTQAALLNWLKGTAMPAAPSGVYVGLFSAASGGNLLASGAVAQSKNVAAINHVKFPVGSLTITLD